MDLTPLRPPALPEPPQRELILGIWAAATVTFAVVAGLAILTVAALTLLNSFANSLKFG